MNTQIRRLLAAGLLGFASLNTHAINIEFDYLYDSGNFFDTQAKKDVLNSAGLYFSNVLVDDLTAITSAGVNSFDAVLSNPATGLDTTINDFSVAANTLTVYVGGRSFGGSTLAVGGPGGFYVSGTQSFVDNAVSRGESGATLGPSATDFAPWGGSLAFNTESNWYFDADPTTSDDVINNDFFSVALHELGHLLGFGLSDSWDNLISGSDFTGAASVARFGGKVPLHSDLSHWADGTMGLVNGVAQEANLDPTLLTGTRKVFTDLDLAALEDIGWEVSEVPLPGAAWLFGSALLGLGTLRRTQSKTSQNMSCDVTIS